MSPLLPGVGLENPPGEALNCPLFTTWVPPLHRAGSRSLEQRGDSANALPPEREAVGLVMSL